MLFVRFIFFRFIFTFLSLVFSRSVLAEEALTQPTWGVNLNKSGGFGGSAHGLSLWHQVNDRWEVGADYYLGAGTARNESYDASGEREFTEMNTRTYRLNSRLHPYTDSSFNVLLGFAYTEVRGKFGVETKNGGQIATASQTKGIFGAAAVGNRWHFERISWGVDWFGIMPLIQSKTEIDLNSYEGALVEKGISQTSGSQNHAATDANDLVNNSMLLYWANAYIGVNF